VCALVGCGDGGSSPLIDPVAPRVVAIGDVHGDLAALRAALRLGQVVDDDDSWIGAETVMVQVGDVLDRGDDERECLEWLGRLATEAEAVGGAVRLLVGNHETMNVELDLRYVTDGGWEDFADTPFDAADPELAAYPVGERGRVAAFRPGGPWARVLAANDVAIVVGATVFVHGGLHLEHVDWGLPFINAAVSSWMAGESDRPELLVGADGPVWTRSFSDEPGESDCAEVEQVLAELGVERMVVGHNPHLDGIQNVCDNRVWQIDVGMAAYYGGSPGVLEIDGAAVRALE
jgi:hypothetical protein